MASWATLSWQTAAEKLASAAAAVQETGLLDWEAASSKAREVATQLQENSNAVATQLQGNSRKLTDTLSQSTKVLAEQAQSVSQRTAEQAKAKLVELKFNEALVTIEEKLNDLSKQIHTENLPEDVTEEELLAFGITSDFQEFVRSLSYSTFRDFPDDSLQSLDVADNCTGSDKQQLTPWQARHATLIVQIVKEINELRFVLCPRRMTDERFWTIYFTLTKKQLPRKAYDRETPVPTFAPPPKPAPQPAFNTDQAKATIDMMSSTLRNTFQGLALGLPAWGSSDTHSAAMDRSGSAQPAMPDVFASSSSADAPGVAQHLQEPSMLDYDPDLEEYLKVAGEPALGADSSSHEGQEDAEDDGSDLDLDGYFNQLQASEEDEEGATAQVVVPDVSSPRADQEPLAAASEDAAEDAAEEVTEEGADAQEDSDEDLDETLAELLGDDD